MYIEFSPEMKKTYQQMDDNCREITEHHMSDDFGLAFATLGSLIRNQSIQLTYTDEGLIAGTEGDIDYAMQEIYKALRVQRAICQKPDSPDTPMLVIERRDAGF